MKWVCLFVCLPIWLPVCQSIYPYITRVNTVLLSWKLIYGLGFFYCNMLELQMKYECACINLQGHSKEFHYITAYGERSYIEYFKDIIIFLNYLKLYTRSTCSKIWCAYNLSYIYIETEKYFSTVKKINCRQCGKCFKIYLLPFFSCIL